MRSSEQGQRRFAPAVNHTVRLHRAFAAREAFAPARQARSRRLRRHWAGGEVQGGCAHAWSLPRALQINYGWFRGSLIVCRGGRAFSRHLAQIIKGPWLGRPQQSPSVATRDRASGEGREYAADSLSPNEFAQAAAHSKRGCRRSIFEVDRTPVGARIPPRRGRMLLARPSNIPHGCH